MWRFSHFKGHGFHNKTKVESVQLENSFFSLNIFVMNFLQKQDQNRKWSALVFISYLKFFRGEQKTDRGAFLSAHPSGLKHLKKLIWSMPLQIYMSMWLAKQYFMLLLGCKWAWWVFWYLLPRSSFVTAILNTHTEPKKQKALQTNPGKRSIIPVIFHFCTNKNSSENIWCITL